MESEKMSTIQSNAESRQTDSWIWRVKNCFYSYKSPCFVQVFLGPVFDNMVSDIGEITKEINKLCSEDDLFPITDFGSKDTSVQFRKKL